MDNYKVKTDLAVEINEEIMRRDGALKGVMVQENKDEKTGIGVCELKIINRTGEIRFNKPKGTYVTIEADRLISDGKDYRRRLIKILTENMEKMVLGVTGNDRRLKGNSIRKILVVGLGNKNITADSLGPVVVDNLRVNRHIFNESGYDCGLCAINPGVMADTGMETADIVKGVSSQICPDIIIAIDALSARSMDRLNSTIQLADTGIKPGSGVGNHRQGLTKENIGFPVMAIGVPTVIDGMTPKNINEDIKNICSIIAASINICSKRIILN